MGRRLSVARRGVDTLAAARPGDPEGRLPTVHFWLHAIGALAMNLALFAMLSGALDEATVGPVMPFAEMAIGIGVLVFGWNVLKNAN